MIKIYHLSIKKEPFVYRCFMYAFFLFLIIVLCVSCKINQSNSISAKQEGVVKLNSDILIGPGECLLKTFQGTSVNNRFYVNWIFISNTNNFIFQLESSNDGKHYKPYCIKQGVSSPNAATALMLTVKDSMQNADKLFFRLKAIPHNYNLNKNTGKEYLTMIKATTILVKKNKHNNKYNLEADKNETSNFKLVSFDY